MDAWVWDVSMDRSTKRASLLLASTGSDEEIVAACIAQSPEAGMRSALGLAGAGLVGGALGSLAESVTRRKKRSEPLGPDPVANVVDSDVAEFCQAIGDGPVLLGLTPSILIAWTDKGSRTLMNVPVSRVRRIATEPSSVSPTARVLALQLGRDRVRLDRVRSHIVRFAKALAEHAEIRLDEY